MTSKKFAAASFLCGILGLLATYSLAASLKAFLEEAARDATAGLPYAIGVFVAGAAASICIFYFGYLFLTGWNSHHALSALQLCTSVAFVAVTIATVAFVVVTGLFNAVGLIGIALASAGTAVVLKVAAAIKQELQPLQSAENLGTPPAVKSA